MKKIIFTLFAAVLATGAFAQISGGIKAGLNVGTLSGSNDTWGGIGIHFGAYGSYALNDAMSLQPELLYNSTTYVTDFVDDVTLKYLSIPVMFKYGFMDNKFNVQAGPQLSMLLGASPSEYEDFLDIKGTDLALNLGAGVNFGKFNLTVRYCIGLSNDTGFSGADLKANAFQASAGFRLFGE